MTRENIPYRRSFYAFFSLSIILTSTLLPLINLFQPHDLLGVGFFFSTLYPRRRPAPEAQEPWAVASGALA
jgi:hypothetical protein